MSLTHKHLASDRWFLKGPEDSFHPSLKQVKQKMTSTLKKTKEATFGTRHNSGAT